jgi:hypothetical protein
VYEKIVTLRYASLQVILLVFSSCVYAQNLNYASPFTGPGSQYISSSVSDASGNTYIIGTFTGTIDFNPLPALAQTAGPAFGTDVWIGKYNSSGSLLWAHGFVGGGDDAGLSIALDNTNNVYIVGFFDGNTDINPAAGVSNATNMTLAKYNTSGTFQWQTRVAYTSNYSIVSDASGNTYLGGTFSGTLDQLRYCSSPCGSLT